MVGLHDSAVMQVRQRRSRTLTVSLFTMGGVAFPGPAAPRNAYPRQAFLPGKGQGKDEGPTPDGGKKSTLTSVGWI